MTELEKLKSAYDEARDAYYAACEATEQKLHDFRQEVSDAVEQAQTKDWDIHPVLWRFIIPAPNSDPLGVRPMTEMERLKAARDAYYNARDVAEYAYDAACDAYYNARDAYDAALAAQEKEQDA